MKAAPIQEKVQIQTPVDVREFIRHRVSETGLTQLQLIEILGHANTSLLSKVMNSRACLSKSSHFEAVCDFLKIDQQQQAAILLAEAGRTQTSRYRRNAPQEAL